MNARLEKKLRLFTAIVVVGTVAGLSVNFLQGRTSHASIVAGSAYGLLLSVLLGGIELFILGGPMRDWLGRLSFTASLIARSTIYAAIIVIIQGFSLGELIAGLPVETSRSAFWSSFVSAAIIAVLMNLTFSIANIIGPRAFLNFVTGRYHSPVEEDRFILFVDIAGSTGLRGAARRPRHPPPARSHVSPSDLGGGGLSRRSAQLCRRRSDRDLA